MVSVVGLLLPLREQVSAAKYARVLGLELVLELEVVSVMMGYVCACVCVCALALLVLPVLALVRTALGVV
jgi:hypothetical protein